MSNSINFNSTTTTFDKLQNAIKQGDDKVAKYFDDGTKIQDIQQGNASSINKRAENIIANVKNASKNTAATKCASNKANSLKKANTFMGSTIKKVTTKDNTTKVTLADSKTKQEYTVTIQYDKAGNSVHAYNLDGVKYEKVYDSNGNIIQKKQAENNITSTKTYSVVEGKNMPIRETISDSKNSNYSKTIYYNEDGVASRATVNDGVTTSITDYEYDNKGKKIGTRTESYLNKSPNEKTYKTNLYKYDSKGNLTGKTTFVNDSAGKSTTTSEYTYNSKYDKYYITSSTEKQDDGTVIKSEFKDTKTDPKGNITSRNIIRTTTKDKKSTTLYGTETYKNGKVTEKKYYSDKDKNNLNATYNITYDKNGNKQKVEATYKKGNIITSKTSKKITIYNTATGEIKQEVLTQVDGSKITKDYKDGKLTNTTTKPAANTPAANTPATNTPAANTPATNTPAANPNTTTTKTETNPDGTKTVITLNAQGKEIGETDYDLSGNIERDMKFEFDANGKHTVTYVTYYQNGVKMEELRWDLASNGVPKKTTVLYTANPELQTTDKMTVDRRKNGAITSIDCNDIETLKSLTPPELSVPNTRIKVTIGNDNSNAVFFAYDNDGKLLSADKTKEALASLVSKYENLQANKNTNTPTKYEIKIGDKTYYTENANHAKQFNDDTESTDNQKLAKMIQMYIAKIDDFGFSKEEAIKAFDLNNDNKINIIDATESQKRDLKTPTKYEIKIGDKTYYTENANHAKQFNDDTESTDNQKLAKMIQMYIAKIDDFGFSKEEAIKAFDLNNDNKINIIDATESQKRDLKTPTKYEIKIGDKTYYTENANHAKQFNDDTESTDNQKLAKMIQMYIAKMDNFGLSEEEVIPEFDINKDGEVTAIDRMLSNRSGIKEFDLNGDNKINILDATESQKRDLNTGKIPLPQNITSEQHEKGITDAFAFDSNETRPIHMRDIPPMSNVQLKGEANTTVDIMYDGQNYGSVTYDNLGRVSKLQYNRMDISTNYTFEYWGNTDNIKTSYDTDENGTVIQVYNEDGTIQKEEQYYHDGKLFLTRNYTYKMQGPEALRIMTNSYGKTVVTSVLPYFQSPSDNPNGDPSIIGNTTTPTTPAGGEEDTQTTSKTINHFDTFGVDTENYKVKKGVVSKSVSLKWTGTISGLKASAFPQTYTPNAKVPIMVGNSSQYNYYIKYDEKGNIIGLFDSSDNKIN